MKTNQKYCPPQVELVPVVVEANFMGTGDNVNGGVGTPGFDKDDFVPTWG
jgi:hypothetical protein